MINCPKCRTVNEDAATYCIRCGAMIRNPAIHFCSKCGAENQPLAQYCIQCGVALAPMPPITQTPGTYVQAKLPALAGILSFFIPGVGQMYNGQIVKGIVLLVLSPGIFFSGSISGFIGGVVVAPLCCLMPVAIWIVGIIDAVMIANKLNAGRRVGDWEFF